MMNFDALTFGKWSPSSASAELIIYIRSFWNYWFNTLSLKLKPKAPLDPKLVFSQVIKKCIALNFHERLLNIGTVEAMMKPTFEADVLLEVWA